MDISRVPSRSIGKYAWVALGVAFVAQCSNSLASLAVAPLAPLFQPELGLNKTEVGLFSSATYVGALCSLILGGLFTDRFGAGRAMALGQFLMGSLVVSMATVSSFPQAVITMAVAGLGMGTVSPGMTKAVVDWFPARVRATAMGVKQGGVPFAGIVVASVLPALALMIGWRFALAAVGLVILLGGTAAAFLYHENPGSGDAASQQPDARSGLAEVLRNRQLWAVSIAGTLMTAGQSATTTYLALYFNEVVLLDSVPDARSRIVAAGGFLAICQVGGLVARVFWGVVSDRAFGVGRVIILAVIGGLSALMCLILSGIAGYPMWLLAIVVFAAGASTVGFGGLFMTAVAEASGPRLAGTGVGLGLSLIQMGNFTGAPVFGIAVDTTGSYQVGWIVLAGLFVAGTATAIATRHLGQEQR